MTHAVLNDRFAIYRQIGEGGFGSVFLAYDKLVAEVCAIKIVRSELAASPELHERFHREAKVWMDVGKHPNIVAVHRVDHFNGKLFLAMDYVPPDESGVNTLEGRLNLATPSLRNALKWSLDICQGMQHAVLNGLVAHRDLKPSNLMLDANGNIKITDFGIALSAHDIDKNLLPCGTPAYMAPEQFIAGAEIDERSDIYSFGIILFQLISTGVLPFHAPTDRLRGNISAFYQLHLSFIVPDIESPLLPIVRRCLEKQKDRRFSSFVELSKSLGALYESETKQRYTPLNKHESNANEHINLAASYLILDDASKAFKHINAAIGLDPANMRARNNLGCILSKMGKPNEAISVWEHLTELAPHLALPRYNLGLCAMQQGKTDAAIVAFRQAISLDPEYVPAVVNLAICYQKRFDYEAALECYDTARSLSPNDSQISYNKAFCLYELKDYSAAYDAFKSTIQLNRRHVSSYNYMGLCKWAMGSPHEALSYFEQALTIDPEYAHAKDNIQRILRTESH